MARISRLTPMVAIATVIMTGTACTGSDQSSAQRDTTVAFAQAVGDRDAQAAARVTDRPTVAARAIAGLLAGLGIGVKGRFTVLDVRTKGAKATAHYRASWSVPDGQSTAAWKYTGTLPLVRSRGAWRVVWRARNLHPDVGDATRLVVARTAGP